MAHSPDSCKSVFVTYSKLFGILAGAVVVTVGGTWRCAIAEANQNGGIAENRRCVQNLERKWETLETKLFADMDTLKRIAREGR